MEVRRKIGIETGAVAGAAGAGAAVAEAQRNRAVGLAGDTPYGAPDTASVDGDFDAGFIGKIQIAGGLFADDDRVILCEAGDRARYFLQPLLA